MKRTLLAAFAIFAACGAPPPCDPAEPAAATVVESTDGGDADAKPCTDCGYLGGPCCAGAFCPQGGRPVCDDGLVCNETSVCWTEAP